MLTPLGLRPPSVSKTDLQNLKLFHLFSGLTSLTNAHLSQKRIAIFVKIAILFICYEYLLKSTGQEAAHTMKNSLHFKLIQSRESAIFYTER